MLARMHAAMASRMSTEGSRPTAWVAPSTVSGSPPRPKLNVIVVVWNDAVHIAHFYERARSTLDGLSEVDWGLVFVNNDSQDDSLARLLALRAADDRVGILTLSRNFGYHAALVAGLSTVEADLYAIVDVDCEDPPELLAGFLERIRGGSQLAYGIRSDRDEPWPMTLGRQLFYMVNRLLADSAMVMWMG